jgi:hypothetical protein
MQVHMFVITFQDKGWTTLTLGEKAPSCNGFCQDHRDDAEWRNWRPKNLHLFQIERQPSKFILSIFNFFCTILVKFFAAMIWPIFRSINVNSLLHLPSLPRNSHFGIYRFMNIWIAKHTEFSPSTPQFYLLFSGPVGFSRNPRLLA